jgi:malonate-semialdehyde dehydrogenase (acetylating)/methylmalonate-semialdehyde dehydrogenase
VVTEINHFINGKQVSGGTECSLPVFNPATGEQTGRGVPSGAKRARSTPRVLA